MLKITIRIVLGTMGMEGSILCNKKYQKTVAKKVYNKKRLEKLHITYL